jgi:UDP-2-acetamido-2,6-beta-L-arabino-hexul-4-ose reductase
MGKNLIERLRRTPEYTVLQFDVTETEETLGAFLKEADVVFHLAGVNRPDHEDAFITGNSDLTMRIVARLVERKDKPLLVLASSIQAAMDNPYGRSKRKAEDALEEYGAVGGDAVIIRLPNVFGKWSRPNYNSAVATFCHNIARGLEITISDRDRIVELIYIDDVVDAFAGLIDEPAQIGTRRIAVGPVTPISLGALVDEIHRIHDIRAGHVLPDMDDRFRRALYATYLSFLPENDFAYGLVKKEDQRGALAEFLKSPRFGQIFVSHTKPGSVRGNHFHDTKVEKFFVLAGDAMIRFRHIADDDVVSYPVSGTDFRVVDIPPGYTHSIENVGDQDLVVLFWSSEVYTPTAPDTHPRLVSA